MELDQQTLADLSIFSRDKKYSVFQFLNFTRTIGGQDNLENIFLTPLHTPASIKEIQEVVKFIKDRLDQWPSEITNGTLMVIDKFMDAENDPIPLSSGSLSPINSFFYRYFVSSGYSLIRYSLNHIYIFLKGMDDLITLFYNKETPAQLKTLLKRASHLLERREIQLFMKAEKKGNVSTGQTIRFGHYLRYRHHHTLEKLMDSYYWLDAWFSMATAVKKFQFTFPEFVEEEGPALDIKGLYHPLLEEPVAYDVGLDQATNFLFLTGANMAGKSTFIKAVGLSVFLSHIGMGVPAKKMKLSFFDGLLSNIQVEDNIFLGESFFFNEVQRIKKTIIKINDGRKWLILIDEMFKGTNFQDAMHCSIMVIEGLIKMKDSLFVLSTHLYEIAESLKKHSNITFRFFETTLENEEPQYSYQLKEGISNDRLGFLILKKEKVLDLLDQIKEEKLQK